MFGGKELQVPWTFIEITIPELELCGFYWSKRKRGIFLQIFVWLAMLYALIYFWTHEYGHRRIGFL
jgi:hypothetical protein